jgi:hypothetical protein
MTFNQEHLLYFQVLKHAENFDLEIKTSVKNKAMILGKIEHKYLRDI